jgi:hypothetical protein
MRTRSAGPTAVDVNSSVSVPYSSAYCWSTSSTALARLAHGHEPRAELMRHGSRNNEPTGLDPDHVRDTGAGERRRQTIDRETKRLSIGK